MWQNSITWKHIDTIYSFIFIKATQSLRADVNFYHNWNNCHLIKGAYHFFNPNINGQTQAKFFLSIVKLEKGNLPPVIDIEYYHYYWRNCNKYIAAKNLRLMLEYIEKTTGVKPIIYTNCSFWNRNLAKYITFNPSNYYLWVANYYTESPCLPLGWTNWTFWQYTPKGKINNHSTYWDLNYFNGKDLKDILIK
jgi:lysozyme